jgi:hypothetical protein
MSVQIQYLRGSAAQLNSFTGVAAEIVVDTTDWTLRVLDGATVGGYALVGLTQTQTLTNKTLVNPVITGSLSVSGNVIVGNLSATGTVSGTSFNYSNGTPVISNTGNANVNTLSATGNVTANFFIGNGSALTGIVSSVSNTAVTVTGNAQANITSVGTLTGLTINNATTAITNGAAAGTGNIGASGAGFNTVFAKATSAQYADLAEKYVADAEYASGTVVVFGGTAEVTVDAVDSDRRVAGVVSTNPAYIMNDGLAAPFVATVALTGRVPCLVTGLVHKGDLMVTAGLGRARAEADPRPGTIIGKALEDFDGESGTIEVVVGRS